MLLCAFVADSFVAVKKRAPMFQSQYASSTIYRMEAYRWRQHCQRFTLLSLPWLLLFLQGSMTQHEACVFIGSFILICHRTVHFHWSITGWTATALYLDVAIVAMLMQYWVVRQFWNGYHSGIAVHLCWLKKTKQFFLIYNHYKQKMPGYFFFYINLVHSFQ